MSTVESNASKWMAIRAIGVLKLSNLRHGLILGMGWQWQKMMWLSDLTWVRHCTCIPWQTAQTVGCMFVLKKNKVAKAPVLCSGKRLTLPPCVLLDLLRKPVLASRWTNPHCISMIPLFGWFPFYASVTRAHVSTHLPACSRTDTCPFFSVLSSLSSWHFFKRAYGAIVICWPVGMV